MNYGRHIEDMTELSLLPCGASLRRFDDDLAVIRFRNGPLGPQGEPLRQGDAALFCREGCAMFNHCPLVEKFVEVCTVKVERELLGDILLHDLKRRHGHGNLPDVGDPQSTAPVGPAVKRLRFLFKHDDGKPHVVIPPMAEVVDNGDDRGDSGRKGGEADKRVEDGLVD